MTGVTIVLLIVVFAELAIRDGLRPLQTLGGAASGELVLRD